MMVDVVVRHEHLQAGLDDVCRRVALPTLDLPRAKAHFRPPGAAYHDVLTAQARRAVDEAYAAEFEHHGYTW
ncbi:hypothetical protein [Streptomyces syringium]|uniref:hypothetical protein n=1 Tax=Streptomyces syringium TaxID=76729 RepID=UPI00340C1800